MRLEAAAGTRVRPQDPGRPRSPRHQHGPRVRILDAAWDPSCGHSRRPGRPGRASRPRAPLCGSRPGLASRDAGWSRPTDVPRLWTSPLPVTPAGVVDQCGTSGNAEDLLGLRITDHKGAPNHNRIVTEPLGTMASLCIILSKARTGHPFSLNFERNPKSFPVRRIDARVGSDLTPNPFAKRLSGRAGFRGIGHPGRRGYGDLFLHHPGGGGPGSGDGTANPHLLRLRPPENGRYAVDADEASRSFVDLPTTRDHRQELVRQARTGARAGWSEHRRPHAPRKESPLAKHAERPRAQNAVGGSARSRPGACRPRVLC